MKSRNENNTHEISKENNINEIYNSNEMSYIDERRLWTWLQLITWMELDHMVELHYMDKIDEMHIIHDMDEVDNIDEMNYMIIWKKSIVVTEIWLCFFSMLTNHMNMDLCHVIVIQVLIVFDNFILYIIMTWCPIAFLVLSFY